MDSSDQMTDPGYGAPTQDFAKFSRKLHEIEGRSLPPNPLDPPMTWMQSFLDIVTSSVVELLNNSQMNADDCLT